MGLGAASRKLQEASRPGRREERYQTSGYRVYTLYLKEMAVLF
jgi:hypothetical protein